MDPRPILASLALAVASLIPARAGEPFDPDRLEREVLVPEARDAIQLAVLPGGDLVFAEFWGTVKHRDAATGVVTVLGKIDAHAKGEVGLLGLAVPPDFAESGRLFVQYCPQARPDTMRVSRFTVREQRLAPASEEVLLSWPYDTEHVFHMGGALWLDGKGDLFIGTGDNCHWNPGLPVDPRPGRRSWDAQRSAANSRDLRGKVLRIHPLPEGGYAIPEGNLFPDGADGAPEIYCLGLRNPFRLSVDDATGMLYVADVGPNVLPELGVTPAGYEELHATTTAANLGWPYFVGPNEPLPLYDFDAMREIARQRPESPRNDSPNNTGRRELPPAQPALVWYDNLPSERFPSAGSGGRSLLAGPVYRHDPDNPSPVKLPEAFDGRLFLADWMRNWIQTVRLGGDGPELEPFQPAWDFRRPVDLKFGDDGALYLIEYGDQWWENRDSRIVRVVYRRGNRVPRAALAASGTAGPEPLSLTFDAAASTDPDGDPLAFAWTVDGQPVPETAPRLAHTFTARGGHEVTVTATDSHGATATARQVVHAGNGRPQVAFSAPLHGSFFDWDRPIPYSVDVAEADGDAVDLSLVSVEGEFRSRPHGEDGDVVDPGLALMRSSTCFACHQAATPSAGPPYRAVALKYRDDPDARERLSAKILAGGAGAWGPLPMPPHPQHGLDEARQMVGWVLSLADPAGTLPLAGPAGSYPAPPRPSAGARVDEGVLILTAAYTDDGKGGTLPRLRGEQALVLHSRRKKAAFADASVGMARVEQVEGEKGIVGHFPDGAHAVWRDLRLDGVRSVTLRAGGLGARGGRFELRRGAPDGPLLATVDVAATGEAAFSEVPVPFPPATGLADLCVVARGAAPDTVLGLNWIEFRDQAPTP